LRRFFAVCSLPWERCAISGAEGIGNTTEASPSTVTGNAFFLGRGAERVDLSFVNTLGGPVKYFTMLWREDTCADHRARGWSGRPLRHMGSNLFSSRGIKVGDRIYAVSTSHGRLILIGALTVGEMTTSREIVRRAVGYEPWNAAEHVIAAEDSASPMSFDNVVPSPAARSLLFRTAGGATGLVFRDSDRLDQQTLRGIRRLDDDSASVLESLLARQ
jgi:hypothetical protein